MSRRKPEGPTHLLCVVATASADDVGPAIAHQRAQLQGKTAAWVPDVPTLWNPNTVETVRDGSGRPVMIIPIEKLDPRVKFVAVYIDDYDASMSTTLGELQ